MSRFPRILLAGIIALAILPVGTAEATITVANTNDSGAGSLRGAIAAASPGEVVVVPAGTYNLTSSELLIEKGLTISGHSSGDTIIRAEGTFRVLEVRGGEDVTISGVTIRDGRDVESNARGGGVRNSGNLTLREVVVTDNLAKAPGSTAYGGGVLNTGELNLIDSSVTENVANASGGSSEAGGTAEGGGIANESDAELTIEGSTISRNFANARGAPGGIAEGGGIFASITEPGSISASTVSENDADASGEGGEAGGRAEGGGLMVQAGTSAPLTNLTVAANTVSAEGTPEGIAEGGGLFTEFEGSGQVSLSSLTIASNLIEGTGGGIDEGANLFANIPTMIENSIVSDGVGPAESGNCAGEHLESQGFNLDSANDCGFGKPGDQIDTDPRLGPLQENEGPAPTMAPATTSPAVDHGSAFGVTVDERGKPRPVDLASSPNASAPGADGSDIGAVELQGPAATVTPPPSPTPGVLQSPNLVPPDFDTAVFLSPKTLYLRLKCPPRFKPGCVGNAVAVTGRTHGKAMSSSVSAKQKPNHWKVAVLEIKPQYTAQVAQMAAQPSKKLLIVRQLIHSKRFEKGKPQSVFHIYRVRTATSG